jgi:hypothetical protein
MSKTTNIQSRAGEVGTRRESIDKLRTLPDLVLKYDRDFINDLARSIEYSIKRFGRLLRPVIVSRDLYVLDGNAIITAAGRLGLREVDVYEVPITCAEDVTVCIGLYYTLNELRRKDMSPTARRRALYELVLRYLANLVDDEYAELVQEMYNDVVPNKLIKYIQSLAPLPYATIYRDLELFIVHPKLFEGIVQVRNTDIKRMFSSIPDSIFDIPHSLVEVLKSTPRDKRAKLFETPETEARATKPATEALGTPLTGASIPGASSASGASGAPLIYLNNNLKNINKEAPANPALEVPAREAPSVREAPSLGASVVAAPSPGAPGIGVSSRGSLDIASAVKYAKDQLEDVMDELRRRLEDYSGLEESDLDKLVRDLRDWYIVYKPHIRFMEIRDGAMVVDERMHALRYLIYKHVLDVFEDVVDAITSDIRNAASSDEALVRLYGALRNADRRIGVGRARGPRGMIPYFAALMCEVLKALDEISGNFYASGVERVCKDVEEYVLRKFDDMRRNAR